MRLIPFGGTFLEKCGKMWKNGRFSGRLWPDWGNTTRVAMARLGSIGLMNIGYLFLNTQNTITNVISFTLFNSLWSLS